MRNQAIDVLFSQYLHRIPVVVYWILTEFFSATSEHDRTLVISVCHTVLKRHSKFFIALSYIFNSVNDHLCNNEIIQLMSMLDHLVKVRRLEKYMRTPNMKYCTLAKHNQCFGGSIKIWTLIKFCLFIVLFSRLLVNFNNPVLKIKLKWDTSLLSVQAGCKHNISLDWVWGLCHFLMQMGVTNHSSSILGISQSFTQLLNASRDDSLLVGGQFNDLSKRLQKY